MKRQQLISGLGLIVALVSCSFGSNTEPLEPATAQPTETLPTATIDVHESDLATESPTADSTTTEAVIVEPTEILPTATMVDNLAPQPSQSIIRVNQLEGSFDGGVSISANGRFTTFVSNTPNPVLENGCLSFTGNPQPCSQVYTFDRVNNSVQIVSVANNGTPGNGHSGTWAEAGHHTSISDDGRFIAFASGATNLTPELSKCTIFVHDMSSKETECVGRTANLQATSWFPVLSADGRFVAFNSNADDLVANDANELWDVFVYDRHTDVVERISIASDGSEGNNISGHWFAPDISADGRYIVFVSWASNLVAEDKNDFSDVYIYDRETNQIDKITSNSGLPANGNSINAVISANGQFVAFESEANNLVVEDTNNAADIFVYDLQTSTLQLVSLNKEGEQGDSISRTPSISADGRFVAFASRARNLVSEDNNLKEDIFVYDRQSGSIERVRIAELGSESNGQSKSPAISADGQWLAFVSEADNLVSNDLNQSWDVFIYDLTGLFPAIESISVPTPTSVVQLGPIEWISRATDGTAGNGSSEAPSLSANGRFLAFSSRASNLVPNDSDSDCADDALDPPQFSCSDVFVYDRLTGEMERVSVASDGTPGNSESGGRNEAGSLTSISSDGRFVAFQSYAWNLVPSCPGVYVHDRQTRETRCVAVASDGTMGNGTSSWPVISANGRFVVFVSDADNLVPNDTNGFNDYFVHDLQTGQTERVSVASDGTQANNVNSDLVGIASLSADGRFVAFSSYASNLVANDTNDGESYGAPFTTPDIFVHDRQTGETTRVSVASDGTEANGDSFGPSISADGRFVAFVSNASNLIPNDTNTKEDVFVHDRQTGQTTRVSVASDGSQAMRGDSSGAILSADGRWVAFSSGAANLVSNDTNNEYDMFIHYVQTGQTVRVGLTDDGREADGGNFAQALSADGCTLAFVGLDSNLVPADTNERWDIFVRNLCDE